jgi:Organic solute transporter Ostalpha
VTYSVALLALFMFYMGAHDLLAPFNPLLKFVLVKSVVFFTFWQVPAARNRAPDSLLELTQLQLLAAAAAVKIVTGAHSVWCPGHQTAGAAACLMSTTAMCVATCRGFSSPSWSARASLTMQRMGRTCRTCWCAWRCCLLQSACSMPSLTRSSRMEVRDVPPDFWSFASALSDATIADPGHKPLVRSRSN